MPKWLIKIFVTLVTVLTLGTVVPSVNYHSEQKPSSSRESIDGEHSQAPRTEVIADAVKPTSRDADEETESQSIEDIIENLQASTLAAAKEQGLQKFGDTIGKRVGNVYINEILPKFGDAVASISGDVDLDTLKSLTVSNNPAGGTGERILNLYDDRTGKELIKLHVRRDHPPLDGYWFNFHYHTAEDNYQMHHELGKVYWDKNTPPQWMA